MATYRPNSERRQHFGKKARTYYQRLQKRKTNQGDLHSNMDRINFENGAKKKNKKICKCMTKYHKMCYNTFGGNSMFLPGRRQEHE